MITKDELAAMTPAQRWEFHSRAMAKAYAAMDNFSEAARKAREALPLAAEAFGPGRNWRMQR